MTLAGEWLSRASDPEKTGCVVTFSAGRLESTPLLLRRFVYPAIRGWPMAASGRCALLPLLGQQKWLVTDSILGAESLEARKIETFELLLAVKGALAGVTKLGFGVLDALLGKESGLLKLGFGAQAGGGH